MDSRGSILIAAASGRALAASARRAGYVPLVADYFSDEDTIATAGDYSHLSNGLAGGMQEDELLLALQRLAVGRDPLGIVCGTGFEDRPELLAKVSEQWKLIGNDASAVARVKDPLVFAQLCRDCHIPHPAISLVDPREPAAWLCKRKGGAGGLHIASEVSSQALQESRYFQRRVPGSAVSVMFAAGGASAIVLGFSEQWSSPSAKAPFRYGGAMRPAAVASHMHEVLADAVHRLVTAQPLVGLNSADFMVNGENFWLLEVNPRPGATLDIFEEPDQPLFGLHVAACEGVLPAMWPARPNAAASAIVYASHHIASFPVLTWPAWATDRPRVGGAVRSGDPLCSVHAAAPSAMEARRLVHARVQWILAAASARLA